MLPNTYGIESWYGAPQGVLDRVRILQRKSVRAIHGLPYNAHTNDYFKTDGILKLDNSYNLHICSHAYKIINGPFTEFSTCFVPLNSIHNYNTRNRNSILPPHYFRFITQFSFLLPNGIIFLFTLNQLKTQINQLSSMVESMGIKI